MTDICMNMLSSLKLFNCPSCEKHFCNKDSTRLHTVTRFPLILTCGHTVCESCIKNQIKLSKSVVCSICKTSVDIPSGEQVNSKFPPDLHVLGILNVNFKQSLPSLKLKSHVNLPKHTQNKDMPSVCENCSKVPALWRCDKCEQNFCDLCFDHLHTRVKSMRKHQGRKIYTEKYDTMVQEGCIEHKRPIEFFCEYDNQLTCSHCVVMGNHKGHNVITLAERNKSCASDLHNVLEEVQVLQKKFKYSERKISESIPLEKIDISGLMKQVHDHFHMLHALLQLRESELISHLDEISDTSTSSLEKMRREISVYEKDLTSVMRDAESVIKDPCLAVSAVDIIKKLEECKTLPCLFVPISDKKDWTVGIELDLDSDIKEVLSKHGKVTADIKPKYCLKTSSEVPVDVLNIINEYSSVADTESVVSSQYSFSDDSLSSPSIDVNQVAAAASHKNRDISRFQEEVVISHIVNPSLFYAQKCTDVRKLKWLSASINKWCRSIEQRESHVTDVEKSDLYLVQYGVDHQWYRGRVLDILEKEQSDDDKQIDDDEMKTVRKDVLKNKELRVKVLYVDYGNTEIVPISKLRNIKIQFLNLPSQAKQCCLWDIVPAHSSDEKPVWSDEAIKTFTQFVGKRAVTMQIIEERNNITYVDLSQSASDDITNDVPVSVRDALVFLEYGCFPSGHMPRKENVHSRVFMPAAQLLVNVNHNAIISHVESPSMFYVQQMSTARYLSELIFEMQNVYNNDHNTMLNGIYVPTKGMICAAQFNMDKQWYRAQILSLPGGSMVEVQYVDFGNKEVVHYKSLRKLFDKFCKLNIQAIPCTLADVYSETHTWSKEATQWLVKKGSKKQLKLLAHGINPGDKLTKVSLYDVVENFEICINALMVEEGFAVSCGMLSKTVKKPVEVATKEPAPPVIAPAVENSVTEVPEKSPAKKTVIQRNPETQNQIQVHVSFVENPGLFYIRLSGETEKKLEMLMDELQMVYSDYEDEIPDFAEGQPFAAYCDNSKKWYRATLLSNVSEDIVQVRFVDYGLTEKLPKKNLRNLIPKFCKDQSFAVRAHLAGIVPAGGSTQWSHMSCDTFQQFVAPHETVYLISKGNADKEIMSLPADLLVEELVHGGALEPSKYVTHSITSLLIEKGVALPVRKDKNQPSVRSSSTNSDSESTITPIDSKESTPQKDQQSKKLPLKPKFQWKPPVPPMEKKFVAMVTNIGDDGCIHLHAIEKGLVNMIKKAIQCKYVNCPYEFLRIPPAVGEACIAKFQNDKLWYRAEILATYIDKVKVLFVDYGNCEILPLTDIRTDIILADFPRQCLECRVVGVKPAHSDKWDDRILDFLHETLVDQSCNVEVLCEPEKHILPTKIFTPSGVDVSELLLGMGVAVPVESVEIMMNKAANLKQGELAAKVFQSASKLPESGYFPVVVTQLFEPNILCIQWLDTPDPSFSYEEQRNEELKDFLHLIKELQERAENFPTIESPKPGMACCAKYGYDGKWYRCEVTAVHDNEATVLYVDYGNSETIPIDRLKRPTAEFLKFPVQIHVCKLHEMVPTSDEWHPKVNDFMTETFFTSEKEIFANVVIPGKISEVHLYIKNDEGSFELAYNELIEEGLILIKKAPGE